MKKKVYFITQAKGGCGKSLLTFMLAEKYPQAVILDLDDATTTSMKQLAYRNPILVSFLDSKTKRIDRGAFTELFESILVADKELFIADLGASVAEQLPKYFAINGAEPALQVLADHDIELQAVCVIGGENIFKATMEYLKELYDSTRGALNIVVAYNSFYPCSEKQLELLQQYTQVHNLSLITFDLVKDKGERTMHIVSDVLNKGQGIVGLSPFTSLYFRRPIEELEL